MRDLKGLVEVTRFFQRDMDATSLGFKIGQTPFDDIAEIDLGNMVSVVELATLS